MAGVKRGKGRGNLGVRECVKEKKKERKVPFLPSSLAWSRALNSVPLPFLTPAMQAKSYGEGGTQQMFIRGGSAPRPGGFSSIKVTGVCSSQNFENTPRRYQNLVLWVCPKFISTPKRYQFNINKLYNWHKYIFQIDIACVAWPFWLGALRKKAGRNLTARALKCTEIALSAVSLGFSTLSATSLQI